MRIGLEIKVLNNLIDKEVRSSAAIDQMAKLTNMHGRFIGYISHQTGDVFQRDIEKAFMISGPSVSEILKLMEKNGLIERRAVERDGRLKRIVLTEKAKCMQAQVEQTFDQVESELSSPLTEAELAELEILLGKIKDHLKNKQEKETLC